MITAHVPSAEQWFGSDPDLITTSTNRNLLQPTKKNKARRQSHLQKDIARGKHRTSSSSKRSTRAPVVNGLLREDSTSSSGSTKSGRSQLVDLVVEDRKAEETERVRARKEGGARWNEDEQKHFVRTYDDEDEGEEIREGFEPSKIPSAPIMGNSDSNFAIDDDEDEEANEGRDIRGHDQAAAIDDRASLRYGDNLDDRNVWNEA